MEEKKKKRDRRGYLNDFELNGNGQYVYSGATYRYDEAAMGMPRRRAVALLLAISFIVGAAAVGAGCITAPGMGDCVYLLVPYAASLMGAISAVCAVCRLAAGGDPLREYVYSSTVKKLPFRCNLTAVCCAAAFLGECVYVILNGLMGKTVWFALFLVLEGITGGGALLLKKRVDGIRWSKSAGKLS